MKKVIVVGLLLAFAGYVRGENVASILEGTAWLVEDIERHGVIDNAQTTVQFLADGKVAGSTACNQYSGSISIKDDTLSFGPMITTRKACPEAVMNQESRFLQALSAVRFFKHDGKRDLLFFHAADGREVVRLSRMEDTQTPGILTH